MSDKPESPFGDLQSIGGIIPYLYYDIIARIIPGCVLLGAIIWSKDLQVIHPFGELLSGVGFIVLGYVVGMLLNSLTIVFDGPWWLLSKMSRGRIVDPWSFAFEINRIKERDSMFGHVLFKMRAEVTLLENLLIGFMLLAILHQPKTAGFDPTKQPVICGFVGVALALGIVVRLIAIRRRAQAWLIDHHEPSKSRLRSSSSTSTNGTIAASPSAVGEVLKPVLGPDINETEAIAMNGDDDAASFRQSWEQQ